MTAGLGPKSTSADVCTVFSASCVPLGGKTSVLSVTTALLPVAAVWM
jgi:hypothetical protein